MTTYEVNPIKFGNACRDYIIANENRFAPIGEKMLDGAPLYVEKDTNEEGDFLARAYYIYVLIDGRKEEYKIGYCDPYRIGTWFDPEIFNKCNKQGETMVICSK